MATATTEVTEATTTRKQHSLTEEQKQAATLRREASMLRKYGHGADADKLEAQADQIAPASKVGKRDNPLQLLDKDEQNSLKNYFRSGEGFAWVCGKISYKKLAELVGTLQNGK